jgi:hypothetical protein
VYYDGIAVAPSSVLGNLDEMQMGLAIEEEDLAMQESNFCKLHSNLSKVSSPTPNLETACTVLGLNLHNPTISHDTDANADQLKLKIGRSQVQRGYGIFMKVASRAESSLMMLGWARW